MFVVSVFARLLVVFPGAVISAGNSEELSVLRLSADITVTGMLLLLPDACCLLLLMLLLMLLLCVVVLLDPPVPTCLLTP